jgi:hypothetical protein
LNRPDAAWSYPLAGSLDREHADAVEKLDLRLMRAMKWGAEALPDDLGELLGCIRMLEALLAEKAVALEAEWADECEAAAAIGTLQELEVTVARRAISTPAATVADVRAKLAIWRQLAVTANEGELDVACDRLILSVEADLQRLGDRQGG